MNATVVPVSTPLRTIGIVAWLAAAVMAAAVVVGLVTAEEGAASALLANVWGRVTVLDLYLALAATWAWIAWRERSPGRAAMWGVGLIVTGSVALGVYIGLAAGRSRTMNELLWGSMDIGTD